LQIPHQSFTFRQDRAHCVSLSFQLGRRQGDPMRGLFQRGDVLVPIGNALLGRFLGLLGRFQLGPEGLDVQNAANAQERD
jgi:hypothetical protein